jgi:hypothetical protein
VLVAAIAGKLLGADAFAEYPAAEIGVGPAVLAVSTAIVLSGLAPLRRNRRRSRSVLLSSTRGARAVHTGDTFRA